MNYYRYYYEQNRLKHGDGMCQAAEIAETVPESVAAAEEAVPESSVDIMQQAESVTVLPADTIRADLQNCRHKLVYLRTRSGEIYWFYPERFDDDRAYGFRWGWQNGWHEHSLPYSDIWSAYCYICQQAL